ncbi:hypothetical protein [Sinorhizobium medicae]|uniref:hypothetical protein n=1 Tax=Sinorhizobium medicae TaxID=110321 RepID=UPI001F1C4749|nr:hypothetical protein [Sinorhizobium medicae]
MREMSRAEFETYEKKVETALFKLERSVSADDRGDFDEIAGLARDFVNQKRELVDLYEQRKEALAEQGAERLAATISRTTSGKLRLLSTARRQRGHDRDRALPHPNQGTRHNPAVFRTSAGTDLAGRARTASLLSPRGGGFRRSLIRSQKHSPLSRKK